MAEKIKIRCPKCGSKDLGAYETTEGVSGHHFENGIWNHDEDYNEYGDMTGVDFRCTKCNHRWTGRKGPTILGYIDDVDDE